MQLMIAKSYKDCIIIFKKIGDNRTFQEIKYLIFEYWTLKIFLLVYKYYK